MTDTGPTGKPYMSVPVMVDVQLPAVVLQPLGTLADRVPDTLFPLPSVISAPEALRIEADVGGLLVLK